MKHYIFALSAALTAIVIGFASPVEAKRHATYHPDCNIFFPCDGAPRINGGIAIEQFKPKFQDRLPQGISVRGVVQELAAKVAEIQSACPGTTVISAVRHTRIRGTGRMSLHASGKAVDLRGPYACIYGQLRDWPGGVSTDARRVAHIHLSLDREGGREMGLRFAHGGGGHRVARRGGVAPS